MWYICPCSIHLLESILAKVYVVKNLMSMAYPVEMSISYVLDLSQYISWSVSSKHSSLKFTWYQCPWLMQQKCLSLMWWILLNIYLGQLLANIPVQSLCGTNVHGLCYIEMSIPYVVDLFQYISWSGFSKHPSPKFTWYQCPWLML